jgi:hypothetical protein
MAVSSPDLKTFLVATPFFGGLHQWRSGKLDLRCAFVVICLSLVPSLFSTSPSWTDCANSRHEGSSPCGGTEINKSGTKTHLPRLTSALTY